MAIYHLRVKNDTKPSGKKVSAKRHAEYILREEGSAHADYINREGAQSNKDDCVELPVLSVGANMVLLKHRNGTTKNISVKCEPILPEYKTKCWLKTAFLLE